MKQDRKKKIINLNTTNVSLKFSTQLVENLSELTTEHYCKLLNMYFHTKKEDYHITPTFYDHTLK